MGELNLVPYSMKAKRHDGHAVRLVVIVSIALAAIMIAGYLVPKLYLVSLQSTEDELSTQAQRYKKVITANNKLQVEINSLKAFNDSYDKIAKDNVKVTDTFNDYIKNFPQDVVVNSISYNTKNITINATDKNYNSICELIGNLQLSDKFKKTSLQTITYNKDKQEYTFSFQTVLNGGDTNAK